METFPNQKTIIVHKRRVEKDFLQLAKEDIYAASNDLSGVAFKLYIYLAANADGFHLALSRTYCTEAMGISKSGYYDALASLESKGYLVHEQGNTYSFYEQPRHVRKLDSGNSKPAPKTGLSSAKNGQGSPKIGQDSLKIGRGSPKNDREIDKINKTHKIEMIAKPLVPHQKEERSTNNKATPVAADADLNAQNLIDITRYINNLEQTEKVISGREPLLKLIEDGKRSAEWIYTALKTKTENEWSVYGFGLILHNSNPHCLKFQREIDDKVKAIVARQKEIAELAKKCYMGEPRVINVIPREKKSVFQPYDLDSIM